ncbi:tripartite-type tricarboxylate transporter receptor subunit TctC [Bradyrhizobium sp. USDA 4501]
MAGWVWRTAIAAAAIFVAGLASAQPFPAKAVHILVPYPPGGGVDVLTRTLAEAVSKSWTQSIVVENRPGAGGVIASQAIATSAPDGYNLIMVASGHATNPFLYPKLPYDTFKDFSPISFLASSPNVLLVRADSPFTSGSASSVRSRSAPRRTSSPPRSRPTTTSGGRSSRPPA